MQGIRGGGAAEDDDAAAERREREGRNDAEEDDREGVGTEAVEAGGPSSGESHRDVVQVTRPQHRESVASFFSGMVIDDILVRTVQLHLIYALIEQ